VTFSPYPIAAGMLSSVQRLVGVFWTPKSLGDNVGIFARGQRRLLPRRVIVLIAAYALGLQSVIAPLIGGPFSPRGVGGFELCLASNSATSPVKGGVPSDTQDHDIHCKLCVHGGLAFLDAPPIAVGWVVQATSVSIRWAVIDNPIPDAAGFIGKQARGPPLPT
jgi:hypothetical protein